MKTVIICFFVFAAFCVQAKIEPMTKLAIQVASLPTNGPYPTGTIIDTPEGECPLAGGDRGGLPPAPMNGSGFSENQTEIRCPVFESESCCSGTFAHLVTGFLDINNKDCQDIMADYYCALCDPNSANFTVVYNTGTANISEIVVCTEFCETLYDRCVDSQFNDNDDDDANNVRVIQPSISKQAFCAGGENIRRLANLTTTCYNQIGAAGGKSGCFIATAAYGSDMNVHVWKLRIFRDQYLHGSAVGDKFVDLYYTYSPYVADFIAQHEWAKAATRMLLWPVVTMVETLFV